MQRSKKMIPHATKGRRKPPPDHLRCTKNMKGSTDRCTNYRMKGKDCCRMHGGSTPIRHGLYSKYAHTTLSDRIEELVSDPKLTDLTQVIATQAALFAEHLEKAKRSVRARAAAFEVSKALVTSIEKWHKITYGEKQVIRIESMKGVADEIVDVITEYVPDKKKHSAILKRIETRILGMTDGSSAVH